MIYPIERIGNPCPECGGTNVYCADCTDPLLEQLNAIPKPCSWNYDSGLDCYDTGCEVTFVLVAGSPSSNGMRFCPYCGGRLVGEELEEGESG